jgi:hypothetical protein
VSAPGALRILFRKTSQQWHHLALVRPDGTREEVDYETRSYLTHDLLHHAVEAEARLAGGFWGQLAAGKTLAQLGDRTGGPMLTPGSEIAAIEQIVGVLSGTVKGRSSSELVAGFRDFADAVGTPTPAWLTEAFVDAVRERMRRLLGHWAATPFGADMELAWPPAG